MLDAIKALFFGGRDNPAVFDQRRGRVAVISVDAEDDHSIDRELGKFQLSAPIDGQVIGRDKSRVDVRAYERLTPACSDQQNR